MRSYKPRFTRKNLARLTFISLATLLVVKIINYKPFCILNSPSDSKFAENSSSSQRGTFSSDSLSSSKVSNSISTENDHGFDQTLSIGRNPLFDKFNSNTIKLENESNDNTAPWHFLCLSGNAQSVDAAINIHESWKNSIPSVWTIKDITNNSNIPSNMYINTQTTRDGFNIQYDMRSILHCEYILYLETVEIQFSVTKEKVEKIHEILATYQPAVASLAEHSTGLLDDVISWQWIHEYTPIIYHKSIVDLFVCPKLSTYLLNFFASSVFQNDAIYISINIFTVEKKSIKNIDNIDNKTAGIFQKYRQEEDTKFTEINFNSISLSPKFTSNIFSISKNKEIQNQYNKWTVIDKISSLLDITSIPISTNYWIRRRFTDKELLLYRSKQSKQNNFKIIIHIFTMNRQESFDRLWKSINSARSISHPVEIQIHLDYPNNSTEKWAYRTYIVHLKSLVSKHGPISLILSTQNKGLRESILTSWSPIFSNEYAIFLEDDIAVSPHFLEYAEQMIARYLHPKNSKGYSSNCIGISLYNLRYDEVNEKPWVAPQHHLPYFLQHPQSWGAVYSADGWNDFIMWYLSLWNGFNPIIPKSLTNRWPTHKTWKKFLLRYMLAQGKFMIYPNFPGGLSLSTNHVEVGTNDKVKGKAADEMYAKFRVPLLDLKTVNDDENISLQDREFYNSISQQHNHALVLNLTAGLVYDDKAQQESNRFNTDLSVVDALDPNALIPPSKYLLSMDKLDVFDAYFNPSKDYTNLKMNHQQISAYDKCTMIMMVYSRTKTILDRLKFYHTFQALDSIIVVWNNLNVEPPRVLHPLNSDNNSREASSLPKFKIPIHFLKQPVNSMNNRFQPFPEIKTDCIITMDDDVDMPHKHLVFAIELFQGHFYDHIIGFRHLGRTHKWNKLKKKWEYSRNNKDGVSIVLPSGSVYHRRFLNMYANELPQVARDIVDELINCDDILFNLMVANATGRGPVVIDQFSRGIKMDGLWNDPSHINERTDCLNRYSKELFNGGMPLKYTTSFFRQTSNGVAPGLKHHKFK